MAFQDNSLFMTGENVKELYPFFFHERTDVCALHDWVLYPEYQAELEADIAARKLGRRIRSNAICDYDSSPSVDSTDMIFNFDSEEERSFANFIIQSGTEEVPETFNDEVCFSIDSDSEYEYDIDEYILQMDEESFRLTNEALRESANQEIEFFVQSGSERIIFPGILIIQECEKQLLQELDQPQLNLQNGSIPEAIFTLLGDQLTKEQLEKYDWLIDVIENSVIYWMDLRELITKDKLEMNEIVRKTLIFIKMNSKKSITSNIVTNEFIQEIISEFNEAFKQELLVQDFEDVCDATQSYLQYFDRFKKTKIYKKVYKLFLYALSASMFEKFGITFAACGFSKLEEEAIKRKHHLGVDFMVVLADSLSYLLGKGFQILRLGRIDAIFHGPKEYAAWYDNYLDIKRKSNLLANPEAHGFNEHEFRAHLDDAIEKGEAIVKLAMELDMSEKKYAQNCLNELKMIKCDITTKQAAREHRVPPFSVLVCGESGIGKSTIKDMLFLQYAKVKNLSYDRHYCYTRNPSANFWDGFTTSQWAVILDDVAFMHPNKAMNGDPSVMEFLQIINAVPFVPDQADLSDKGRTPMKAKLCIATTNTEHLNAHYYFSCASAAQRRFPYIIVPTVKKEFLNNQNMLDSSAVCAAAKEGCYDNCWNWTVKRVCPQSLGLGIPAKIEIIKEFTEVNDFIAWYSKAIITFDENQNTVSNSIKNMETIQICGGCYRPKNDCLCEIQSGIIVNPLQYILSFIISFLINWWITYHYSNLFLILYEMTKMDLFRNLYIFFAFNRRGIQFALWVKRQEQKSRLRIAQMANKINTFFYGRSTMEITGAIALVVTIVTATYRLWNKSVTIQGQTDSKGVAPEPKSEERDNVWYANSFELSNFEVTPSTTSSKSMDESSFIKILKMNVVNIKVPNPEDSSRMVFGVAYCLKGQYYGVNNHILRPFKGTTTMDIVYQSRKDGVTENMKITIHESQVKRDIGNDLCVFKLPNLPPRKGLYNYLPKSTMAPKLNGFLMTRERDGDVTIRQCNRMRNMPNASFGNLLKGITCDFIHAITSIDTKSGDCGSPLIARSDIGFIFVGMHVAASAAGGDMISIQLSQSIIEPLLEDGTVIIQSSYPQLNAEFTNHKIGALHHKSVFRYMDEGSAAVYGSLQGFRMTPKTNVEISPMAHFLSDKGYKIKYGPPIMKGWAPWRIAALDMVNPVTDIDTSIVQECADAYLKDVLDRIDLSSLKELEIYDNFTAINGAAGVSYVDKMNRNTSMGWPFKRGKKFFMESIPAQRGMEHPVKFTDEVINRADIMLDNYIKGERACPIFTGHLKDEPVSFKKIKMKKTRVFTGAPADWTLLVRKYLLSSIRLIQNNKYAFEAGPGTVAQSFEWHQMYEYITKHGEDRIVAGDYKAFDKRMSPIFITKAFDILKHLCSLSGNYTKEDLRVIDGIAIDTAFPLVDFNGDIVQFYGSNPSGHPLTVIINSLVNSLYIRYAYRLMNPEKRVDDFKDHVSLMTYGDDNIMSISKKKNWFHHTSISNALGEIGITYTMADKEAESVPYIHIDNASFLKRTWKLDTDVGAYLAPLDHDSIEKMLMVWNKSKTISEEEQIVAVITSANREYFFYGKEIYEEKQHILKKLIEHLDIEDWIYQSTFPSFSQLSKEFWDNSRKMNCLPKF